MLSGSEIVLIQPKWDRQYYGFDWYVEHGSMKPACCGEDKVKLAYGAEAEEICSVESLSTIPIS
jgi:hypothetical protein